MAPVKAADVAKPHGIRAAEGFVFRTPLLPMTTLLDWAAAGDAVAVRTFAMSLLDLPEVREALFVASPSLSSAIPSWRDAPTSAAGQRVEHSLVKYLARMMGRATPFGLFAGVSTGRLARDTKLSLVERSAYQRRTRLDNDYLFVLVARLAEQPDLRAKLRFRPSSSIYRVSGQMRYAEARLAGSDRSYHLVSVTLTPYLEATLARAATGATLEELAAPLVGADITLEEAHGYIDELIGAQLLVPDLGIYITGPEPIDGLLLQLAADGLEAPRAILASVRGQITAIDSAGLGNPPELYRAIASALEPMPAKVDLARLFQVDLVKPAAATLGTRVAYELANTAAQLSRIRRMRGSFDDFKRAFRARWEDRSVPLAEVLDEESGIGFEAPGGPGAEGSPLLAGLPFAPAQQDDRAPWTALERHLLTRLARALATGDDELVLAEADLDAMKLPTDATFPDAFSIVARIAGTPDEVARGEITVLFESMYGPSGARILGRFCHASPEIDTMVREHHAAEEALRPGAVFAEIVHLNEGRIGNILCRPVLRAHEIVYLGVSGAAPAQQIRIDDLEVSVRGDRIVLTSRRLDREVVPRLTTAHNFRLRSLGVYRFLCALASQDVDLVGWTWGVLGSAPFLPRVRLGKVIVARATWNLDKHDLEPITVAVRAANKDVAKRDGVAAAVAVLRQHRKLPRMLVISAGDNELPIDLDNPLLAAAFADEVSGSDHVELTELFPAPDRTAVEGPEGAFANEIVLMFTRQRGPDRAVAPRFAPSDATTSRRELGPGSDWLYAKIYCGESTADRVLREAIGPLVREAIARGDIDRWFFIRYNDPDSHLRVRFRGDPATLCGGVLPALERAVAPLVEAGAVRKLVLDTYVRELERYGGDRGIELVEAVFWRDSDAVLDIIDLLDGDAGATARWKLCVRGIDSLLDALGLDDAARAKVCSEGRESIGRELRADTLLWSKIGEKFTKERADLELMFDRDPARDAGHEYAQGFEILARRDAAIAKLGDELRARDAAGELTPRLADMAWSLVHMHANRLLHASQRAQEMVLYDFVRRLHDARRAPQGQPKDKRVT